MNNDAFSLNDPDRSPDTEAQEAIAQIAARILGIGTLDTRHRDALDFHDLSVAGLRRALEAAYLAGRAARRRVQRPHIDHITRECLHEAAHLDRSAAEREAATLNRKGLGN